jgi:hypothetical protein
MTYEESSQLNSANSNDCEQNREPSRLAAKLDRNLVTYALAATAAGVGVMALAQPAEANVVATPANIVVPINGGVVQFDINHDGIPDFGLSATTFVDTFGGGVRHNGRPPLGGVFGGHLNCIPAQAVNEVGAHGSIGIRPFAAALPAGAVINSGRKFDSGEILMAGIVATGCGGSSLAYGNWIGSHPPSPFLAVKFGDASGNLHFGWVRIEVKQSEGTHFNATITGYAYETEPNKPITTGVIRGPVGDASLIDPAMLNPNDKSNDGQPASLGILALGAPGLVAWRKQDEAEQKVA